jgi:CBS domain containing-hemolysin-like protein
VPEAEPRKAMTKDESNGSSAASPASGSAAQAESPSDDPGQRPGPGQPEGLGPGWFAALKATLGLGSASLRDTLEQALSADNPDTAAFTTEERNMLLRMLRFGALRVDDIMVPRADIIAVDENARVSDVLKTFVDGGVSRIPLYSDTLDDPRGVVHVKDLLKAIVSDADITGGVSHASVKKGNGVHDAQPGYVNGAEAADVSAAADKRAPSDNDEVVQPAELDLSRFSLERSIGQLKVRRPLIFVPPSMPAMNLLLKMQSTRIHMALVVDEYGGTDGLVTIEDLVEQIVGEIDDEHDDEDADEKITVGANNTLTASARIPVEDLEEHLGVKLLDEDEEDDIDTIGGLVFTLVGRVPSRGELIPHPCGLEFEVLDADPRRIKRLKVHVAKLHAAHGAPPA